VLRKILEGTATSVSAAVKTEQIGRFKTGAMKKGAARGKLAAPGRG